MDRIFHFSRTTELTQNCTVTTAYLNRKSYVIWWIAALPMTLNDLWGYFIIFNFFNLQYSASSQHTRLAAKNITSSYSHIMSTYWWVNEKHLIIIIMITRPSPAYNGSAWSCRDTAPFFMAKAFWLPLTTRTFKRSTHRFLANVNSRSVCLSVVCNVRAPYSGYWNFRQYFYATWYLCHPWPLYKNVTEIVPGEPLRRGS